MSSLTSTSCREFSWLPLFPYVSCLHGLFSYYGHSTYFSYNNVLIYITILTVLYETYLKLWIHRAAWALKTTNDKLRMGARGADNGSFIR
jgi:hypothetical protein